jgi:hypothetical protein
MFQIFLGQIDQNSFDLLHEFEIRENHQQHMLVAVMDLKTQPAPLLKQEPEKESLP